MAQLTNAEVQASRRLLAAGSLFGVGITLAFLGIIWLPLSILGAGLVVGAIFFASRGRVLDALPWLKGASGESQVRRALSEIAPLGYVVVNDVETGYGNVDHVVVGPTGVFAIETKNRGGHVVADHGRLFGRWEQDRRQAIHEAIWVRDHVPARFVEALVVYPSATVDGDAIRLRNVTLVPLARLNAEITSNRSSLGADEIARIVTALSEVVSRPAST